MSADAARSDAVFRAIGDPTRRKILQLLATNAMAVSALCAHFDVSQPAISQHLRVLRDAGLVEARTEWRQRIYHITPAQLKEVADWVRHFDHFWEAALDRLTEHLEGGG